MCVHIAEVLRVWTIGGLLTIEKRMTRALFSNRRQIIHSDVMVFLVSTVVPHLQGMEKEMSQGYRPYTEWARLWAQPSASSAGTCAPSRSAHGTFFSIRSRLCASAPAPAQLSRTQADPQRRYQPRPLLTRVIHEPYADDRALDSKDKSVLAEMYACARSQGVGD
jgi:hypothetical protein